MSFKPDAFHCILFENPKLENLRAMMEAIREYGVYTKLLPVQSSQHVRRQNWEFFADSGIIPVL